MNTWRRAILATLLPVASLVLCACGPDAPDEERIRAAIRAMQTAVEAREAGAFLDHVAEDFDGQNGQYDRAALGTLLRAVLLRHRNIGVSITSVEVNLMGDRATTEVSALLTGGGGMIPDRGEALRVRCGWRLDDDWVVINATWERGL